MSDGARSQPSSAERRRRLAASLASRGVTDERVLAAMAKVERHLYVDPPLADLAYEDRPLSIGAGQTISQPYIVALMAEAAEIEPSDRVLEVGTGSGYGAAVLGCLSSAVWTIERHPALADLARRRLRRDGYTNVNVVIGDGTQGWAPAAPYDAIVVTASPPSIPPDLTAQLADGGRLVIPVGRRRKPQTLTRIRRRADSLTTEDLGPVRFVPLVSS